MVRLVLCISATFWLRSAVFTAQTAAPLQVPRFHHLHLNSINPEQAIDFYATTFPSSSKTTFAGQPALQASNGVLLVFTKVDAPPATQPQTAIWHWGWFVTDTRQALARFKAQGTFLLPLYTSDAGGTVAVNSDTWPGTGGVQGRTRAQIAEAKAKGIKSAGGAGFGYMRGPDGAIVEYLGDMPAERFNHVHMFQDHPFCAQLWYQKHLNAAPGGRGDVAQYTEQNCRVPLATEKTWPTLSVDGIYRTPAAGVLFGDVALSWLMRQEDRLLASTRQRLADHIGLAVRDLEGWVAKLDSEGVKLKEPPYRVGDTRAVMIEGPSREMIELVEIK